MQLCKAQGFLRTERTGIISEEFILHKGIVVYTAAREGMPMRAICQRVSQARVEVNGQIISEIKRGLLVYISIGKADTFKDAEFMAEKLVNLRIFADDAGRMNKSLLDVGADILAVSNFTLHGDCRKGRRPSFDAAAEPELAEQLYEKFVELTAKQGVAVKKGVFGEHMQVSSINDGPVTFLIDSR